MLHQSVASYMTTTWTSFSVLLYRTCRLRTGHIASASRMRCVSFVCAQSTAWRRRSWPLQNTSWTWTRRSSRLACLTRSLQDMSAGPFYRLFWNTRSRMRLEHYHLWYRGTWGCESVWQTNMCLVHSFSLFFFCILKRNVFLWQVYMAFNKSFNVCSTFFCYKLQT